MHPLPADSLRAELATIRPARDHAQAVRPDMILLRQPLADMLADGNHAVSRSQHGVIAFFSGKIIGMDAMPCGDKRGACAGAGQPRHPGRGAGARMDKGHVVLPDKVRQCACVPQDGNGVFAAAAGEHMVLRAQPLQRGDQPAACAHDQCGATGLRNGIGHFQCAPFNPALFECRKNLQDDGGGWRNRHIWAVSMVFRQQTLFHAPAVLWSDLTTRPVSALWKKE